MATRSFSIASILAVGGAVFASSAHAQEVVILSVAPRQIIFHVDTSVDFPLDNPPSRTAFVAGPGESTRFKITAFDVQKSIDDPEGQANFVIVSPSSGIARSTQLTVALNPKVVPHLASGIYGVRARFAAEGSIATATLEVLLEVRPPRITIESVRHGASGLPVVSPGQFVTILGSDLGTLASQTGELDASGVYPRVLGRREVTFNGVPAPLLFVGPGRIDCVAPLALAGSSSAEVAVKAVDGGRLVHLTGPVTVPVTATTPGVFTVDPSGSGPAVAMNTGPPATPNAESNPAPIGSTISLFASGAGSWNFPFPEGGFVFTSVLNPSASPVAFWELRPEAPVEVTIGGQPAKVVRAAAQPLRVFGTLQVDVEVPEGIGSGAQPVVLKIGDYDNSGQNVTVWVQ